MFKTTRLVAALILAGAALSANATEKAVGAVAPGVPAAFNGVVIGAGLFSDVFTFTLPSNGGSGYSVINFPLDLGAAGSFNTIFSSLSLYSNPDGILFNDDDALLTSVAGAGPLGLTWGPSAGGSMYLTVMGVATGTTGGLYSGAISVSPVPEAETWAMMGLGLGLVGLQLRRRKSADT